MANILADYLNRDALAAELGVSARTVARYETEANGLPSVMIGGRRKYKIDSVKAWLERRERKPNPTRRRTA